MCFHLGLSEEPKASWGSKESRDTLMASPPCTGSPAGLLMMSMSLSLCKMLALRCCISASSSISVRRSAERYMSVYGACDEPDAVLVASLCTMAHWGTSGVQCGIQGLRTVLPASSILRMGAGEVEAHL